MGSGDRSPSDGRTDRPPGPSATHTADPAPGRLLAQPKLRAIDGQPRYDGATGILHAIDLNGSECRLVELDCARAMPNRQHGRDRARNGSPRARSRSHCLVPLYIDECAGRDPLTAATPNQTKSASTRSCVRANGGSDWVGARRNSTGIRLNSCATSTKTFKYVARTAPTAYVVRHGPARCLT